MASESDWVIVYRFLVEDTPLLALNRGQQWRFESVGYYKEIIKQLLPLADPVPEVPDAPIDDANQRLRQQLHAMFIEGTHFHQYPFFFSLLDPVADFEAYKQSEGFLKELARYQQRIGQPMTEPLWQVSHDFAGWKNVANYIAKSTIDKMVVVKQQLITSTRTDRWPAGVIVISEDQWDERFGWAKETGLKPSQLDPLEGLASQYLRALQERSGNLEQCRTRLLHSLNQTGLLNKEFEIDAIYTQLKETGHTHLKACIDSVEFLYICMVEGAWINPLIHAPYDDVRQFPVALDWFIHEQPTASLSRYLPYEFRFTDTFMAACLELFQRASPKNVEPLELELQGVRLRLLLAWDAGVPKLANAELAETVGPS